MSAAPIDAAAAQGTPGRRQPAPWVTNPNLWTGDAACRGTDPAEWIAADRHNPTLVAVCHACPVQDYCLDYALHTQAGPAEVGIWGGYDADARRDIRRDANLGGIHHCDWCGAVFVRPYGRSDVYCTPTCATAARDEWKAQQDRERRAS